MATAGQATPPGTSEASPALSADRLPEGFRRLTITARADLARDVIGLQFDSTEPFPAGSHLEVLIPDGQDPPGWNIAHYSLTSEANGGQPWTIAILDVAARPGQGPDHSSTWLFDHAEAGVSLPVRGPRQTFTTQPGRDTLFIAGGIGITPLRPLVSNAIADDVDWRLIYLGRDRASMAFVSDVEGALPQEFVRVWTSRGQGRISLDGLITQWAEGRDADQSQIVVCGPLEMIKEARRLGIAAGIDVLHEAFTSSVPGPTTDGEDDDDGEETGDHEFIAELRDGTEIPVPVGTTTLQALRKAGVPRMSNCERGECGTCETPVLDGEIDHRDIFLDDDEKAEGDTMMVCVSRAKGDRLTLDLKKPG